MAFESLSAVGVLLRDLNTSVPSWYAIQVFQAVFFLLPAKVDVWSHPVNAWKTRCSNRMDGNVAFLAPKAIQSSSRSRLLKNATASTTTSVSTVRNLPSYSLPSQHQMRAMETSYLPLHDE